VVMNENIILQFAGGWLAYYFFKKHFLKSYQVFVMPAFIVAVFGTYNYFICKQKILCRQTVTVF
jgi:hypothetical protein